MPSPPFQQTFSASSGPKAVEQPGDFRRSNPQRKFNQMPKDPASSASMEMVSEGEGYSMSKGYKSLGGVETSTVEPYNPAPFESDTKIREV